MLMKIDAGDERTCRELLLAFLESKGLGDVDALLPRDSIDVLQCVKMVDAHHGGRPSSDVGDIQDCFIVFLSFPTTLAIAEVPTKKFSCVGTRPATVRPPPRTDMVALMVQAASANIHLPPIRAYRKMNGKNILFNDFRDYLKNQGVCFLADLACSLGNDFLTSLRASIFPLSSKVWKALNDVHNRGGATPEARFSVFFGRKIIGKNVDRPDMNPTLAHLQEVWIGTSDIIKKGNWPVVACDFDI
jgi:hypothetical protein